MKSATVVDGEMPSWQMVQGTVRKGFVKGPIFIVRGRLKSSATVAVILGKTYVGDPEAVETAVREATKAELDRRDASRGA